MSFSFIQIGILLSLSGTIFAGLIGLFFSGNIGNRIGYTILAIANFIGAVAGLLFLGGTETSVHLFSSMFAFNLSFDLDVLSAIFYVLIAFVSGCCSIYAISYTQKYRQTYNVSLLACATSLFIFGMQATVLSQSNVGFMLFWEIMSISSFFLVFADRQKASLKAALLYLVMTQLGASAILAGFFLLSGEQQIISDFSTMMVHAQSLPANTLSLVLILFLFGFGSKAGIVPFHVWLPEAHPQAPSHISALMSGIMLKVALYGFLRVISLFTILPSWFGFVVLILGLLSAIFGVLYTIIETDVKRTLAYSSIENIGLIFAMIGLGLFAFSQGYILFSSICFSSAIFHAWMHAFFKSGLFLITGVLMSETHTQNIEQMGGLAKRMPVLSGAFCVLTLSAAALPPFGAFYGEWIFLQNIVSSLSSVDDRLMIGLLVTTLVAFALVGGLAVFAMIKFFAIACLGEPRSEHAILAKDPNFILLTPILILSTLLIVAGAFSTHIFRLLKMDSLIHTSSFSTILVHPSGPWISPLFVFFCFLFFFSLAFFLRKFFSNDLNERAYHTWDCGQPITSGMEFTATAFSAPIRFFFRFLLRAKKSVVTIPVSKTNPWIAQSSMALQTKPLFMEYLYLPIERGLYFSSKLISKIQSGSIQMYLAFIFLSLLLTLLLAL